MPQVITAIGNLVKDPEVKTFEKGSLTKLRIACTDRMSDGNGGWKDGDTNFYDVYLSRTYNTRKQAHVCIDNRKTHTHRPKVQ